MVRAAGLRGLPELIARLGGDAPALLRAYGVTPATLGSGDAVLPAATAARLLEAAAAACDCPDLGLRLAGRQSASVLGPLALAIENAATFGEALDTTRRFLFVHSPALIVESIPDPAGRPGVVGIRYAGTDAAPLPPQAADLGLGLLHRIVLLLHGGPYGLRSVHLPHPALAPAAAYTGFFGTEVRFDRPDAVLRVPGGLAGTPVPGGSRLLRDLAMDHLASTSGTPQADTAGRVRALIAQGLGSAPVGVTAVARRLRLHPRTLQRRLAAEGTTYENLLDAVRRDAAHRLITATTLPFTQVTAMVGLAEQSALSRAVRRWYGVSPRALRAAPTAGGPFR